MGAGALSSDAVVELSESFTRIYVDCTERGANADLLRKYGVRGLPTLVITDAEGHEVKKLVGSRPARAVIAAMKLAAPKEKVKKATEAQDQDELVEKILKRIEKEIEESTKRLRKELADLIRSELKKGTDKTTTPKKKTFADEVKAFARRIKNDKGVNGRLRRFLMTEKGVAHVKQLMENNGLDTVQDAADAYFERDDRGRYVLGEEFVKDVEAMLDVAEGGGEPKDSPKKKGKPYMGFSPADFTDDERDELGLDNGVGIKVYEVREGSPADKAGLKAGDVIVKFDGKMLNEDNIGERLSKFGAGDRVTLSVLRNGKERKIRMLLGSRDD